MRVAVFGAGYAGLTVARRLERLLPETVDIVVVDESTEHLVQHELHRVIRHPDLADAITVPLETILSRAEIRQARVTDIDTENGTATLDGDETLDYDFGAVCLGSETEFYGLTGVEAYATPLKTLADARSIREDALDAQGGDVVIGGGGLSGVQVAGELAVLSKEENLDLDITLVEMAEQIMPGFDSSFAKAVRRELEAREVHIETGIAVESADEETVHLEDGRSLPAAVFVWTGGIRGPEATSGKRQPTPRDLRVSDSTFVVGDAASLTDRNGKAVPASAQSAVQQARVAATNIAKLVESGDEQTGPVTIPVSDEGESTAGETTPEVTEASESTGVESEDETVGSLSVYEPSVAGWVVSVGDGAVAKVGPVVFSGEPAKAAKAAIGFGHLGSVGAIRQASELVAEELGWPTADGLGLAERFDGKSVDSLPTDPASPGQLGQPLVSVMTGFEEVLSSPEAIDLTMLTRQADPNYPGSAMETVQRTLFDSFGTFFETSEEVVAESEPTEIEVESGGSDEPGSSSDDEARNEEPSDEPNEEGGTGSEGRGSGRENGTGTESSDE